MDEALRRELLQCKKILDHAVSQIAAAAPQRDRRMFEGEDGDESTPQGAD